MYLQVIVLAPMYKLSPLYLSSYNQDSFNHINSPHCAMPYSVGELIDGVSLSNRLYDYVPLNYDAAIPSLQLIQKNILLPDSHSDEPGA